MLTLALRQAWGWIVAAGAVLVAVVALLAGARRAGRDAERAAAAEREREARNAADRVRDGVAREPDPVERLRRDWGR